ncbi:hypothetical protein GLOIN_2v1556790, partial [Rhizophagus irregularis DAOM 181602=DAOM 197198]
YPKYHKWFSNKYTKRVNIFLNRKLNCYNMFIYVISIEANHTYFGYLHFCLFIYIMG